jgi:hypothetical protein
MGVKDINHPEKTEWSNPQIEDEQSERFANSLIRRILVGLARDRLCSKESRHGSTRMFHNCSLDKPSRDGLGRRSMKVVLRSLLTVLVESSTGLARSIDSRTCMFRQALIVHKNQRHVSVKGRPLRPMISLIVRMRAWLGRFGT